MRNMLAAPLAALEKDSPEFAETVVSGEGLFRVERIISHGHVTPEGFWYDQDQDEWVTVLEGSARIEYPDGSETALEKGDALLLPKRQRHRVSYTSSPCIWLAVFADTMHPGQRRPGEQL